VRNRGKRAVPIKSKPTQILSPLENLKFFYADQFIQSDSQAFSYIEKFGFDV
jgi:hypothetical protein